MVGKLPQVTARQVVRVLRRDGWELKVQSGSHQQFIHTVKPGKVTVPNHRGTIRIGTLMSIISQAGLTVEEFRELL